MNHRKEAHRRIKRSKNSFNSFRVSINRRYRRRRSSRYKKPNHWHQHDETTFSKIVIRDVEILWLQEYAPEATITLEKVHNCESMPAFKANEWDGMAHFVRFPKEAKENAILFRIAWWNTRA